MYSRRKYAETVRFLKAAIKNESLSYAFRQRSVELLLTIYGAELPEAGDGHLTKKTVKELIQTRTADKIIREGIKEAVTEQTAAEAEAARVRALSAALEALMSPSSPQDESEAGSWSITQHRLHLTPPVRKNNGYSYWRG
jgi:hypothetical protein